VAQAGARAMRAGRRMVVPGLRNRLLLFAERFTPRGVVLRVVEWMQSRRGQRSEVRGQREVDRGQRSEDREPGAGGG
jgi:hypothetical protein